MVAMDKSRESSGAGFPRRNIFPGGTIHKREMPVNSVWISRGESPLRPLAIRPAASYIRDDLMRIEMGLLRATFIWWRNATAGTFVNTWLTGVPVGRDEVGNRYYRSRNGKRRWVIYNGTVDASRVPADWHGWLHRLSDEAPKGSLATEVWEKPHRPNLSGDKGSYRPAGSLAAAGVRGHARGDYQAWRP
jgi:NADH:ubiquinone oxidoreductase subunit